MKQVVMTTPGVVKFRKIPESEHLNADEVLLCIYRIGLCGSNIHVYHGKHPFTSCPSGTGT